MTSWHFSTRILQSNTENLMWQCLQISHWTEKSIHYMYNVRTSLSCNQSVFSVLFPYVVVSFLVLFFVFFDSSVLRGPRFTHAHTPRLHFAGVCPARCRFWFPAACVLVRMLPLPGVSAEGVSQVQLLASERLIAGNVKVSPHQFGLKLNGIFGKCIKDKTKHVGKLHFVQLNQQKNYRTEQFLMKKSIRQS